MKFVRNDGGRVAAGYRGSTGDCVTRALAIAMQLPYAEVYEAMARGNQNERQTKRAGASSGRRTARNGINVRRKWFKDWMAQRGWKWTATMGIGTGCTVHLTDGELPMGRLIVLVSRHYTTVIDGVIHDTHDPQRAPETTTWYKSGPIPNQVSHTTTTGGRCVYGYWSRA